MTESQTPAQLTESRMKDVFRELVTRQDAGDGVEGSRANIAMSFAISLDEVKAIERRGIAEAWPPLD